MENLAMLYLIVFLTFCIFYLLRMRYIRPATHKYKSIQVKICKGETISVVSKCLHFIWIEIFLKSVLIGTEPDINKCILRK